MKAILSLLFAASFWGVVWYPLRLLNEAGLSGVWQMLIAYVCAFLVLAILKWPGVQGMNGQWGKLGLMAITAGWTGIGYVLAMLEGNVARALILFYLSPLWTVLLGYFFLGEKLRMATLATVPLGVLGVILMVWNPDAGLADFSWSDLQALTAGMAFSITNVTTRSLHHLGTRQKTLVSWLGVIVLAAMIILLSGSPVPEVSVPALAANMALGSVGFMLTTLAVIYGISHMSVQKSSVILLIEIVVGAFTAWWLAGEILVGMEWFGGGLIILAGLIAIIQEEVHEQHL
jgi:drug/metabolite transporter (DMT)-like permease